MEGSILALGICLLLMIISLIFITHISLIVRVIGSCIFPTSCRGSSSTSRAVLRVSSCVVWSLIVWCLDHLLGLISCPTLTMLLGWIIRVLIRGPSLWTKLLNEVVDMSWVVRLLPENICASRNLFHQDVSLFALAHLDTLLDDIVAVTIFHHSVEGSVKLGATL